MWRKYFNCGLWCVCVFDQKSGKNFFERFFSHKSNNGFTGSQQLAAIFSGGGRYSPQWSKFQIVATCLFCLFARMCERVVCENSANPNQNNRANPNRTSVVWCATPSSPWQWCFLALIFQNIFTTIRIHRAVSLLHTDMFDGDAVR